MKTFAKVDKPHAHQCRCGTIWAHDPKTIGCRMDEAHDCPDCGECEDRAIAADVADIKVFWDGYTKTPNPDYVE